MPRRVRNRSAILLAVIATCGAIASPARGETVTLGREEAVAQALGRHPAIRAAEHAATGAAARVAQTRTAWQPRLAAEATYRFAGPLPQLSVDTGITLPGETEPIVIRQDVGTYHYAAAGVRAGWRAFDFGARDALTESAEALARAAEAEGDQRNADIAYAVRTAYLSASYLDEVRAITERTLDTARAQRKEEALRRDAGLSEDVAVAGADARIASLEARLVATSEARARAYASLALLLGLTEDTELTLSDRLETTVLPLPEEPGSTPQDRRLAALEEGASRREHSLDLAFWPTIDLFATLHYQYPKSFLEDDAAGLAYVAGVSVTWEVFDGDLRRRQREELEARAAELAALRTAAGEERQRALTDAEARFRSARAGEEAALRSLKAADVYLRAARTSAMAGTGTALDVRKAEEAVDAARLALLEARLEAALARATALHVLGVAALDPS